MSSGAKVPLKVGQMVAAEVIGLLWSECERIEIAGSVRRERPEIGDVELVAIPRYRDEAANLWGDTTRRNLLVERITALAGKLERLSGGERYQKLIHVGSGLQVDLFMANADNWGLIYTIRTGPAAYSQSLVTYARRQGFHSSGGYLREGLCARDVCGCPIIAVPEEEDLFRVLDLEWRKPGDRQ